MTFAKLFSDYEIGVIGKDRHGWRDAGHLSSKTEESLTLVREGRIAYRLTKAENGTIAEIHSPWYLRSLLKGIPALSFRTHWSHGLIVYAKVKASPDFPLVWYAQGKEPIAFHEDEEGTLMHLTPPRRDRDEEIVHRLRRGARMYCGYAWNWGEDEEPKTLMALRQYIWNEPSKTVVKAALSHAGIIVEHTMLPERVVRDALREYYTDKYYELSRPQQPTLPL